MENKNNITVTLSVDTVLDMHRLIADKTGGSPELRDIALLESALNSPFQTFGGEELYPSALEKGAMLGYGLICNHPFVDGNKRIGVLAMLVFFKLNGAEITASNEEVARVGLGVASGEMKYEQLIEWVSGTVTF